MYFYGFFQSDVSVNFLIPFRRTEAISCKHSVTVKRDPGSTKQAG